MFRFQNSRAVSLLIGYRSLLREQVPEGSVEGSRVSIAVRRTRVWHSLSCELNPSFWQVFPLSIIARECVVLVLFSFVGRKTTERPNRGCYRLLENDKWTVYPKSWQVYPLPSVLSGYLTNVSSIRASYRATLSLDLILSWNFGCTLILEIYRTWRIAYRLYCSTLIQQMVI